jgi:hypothetical protein
MKRFIMAFSTVIVISCHTFAASGITSVFDIGIGVKAQSLGGAYAAALDDSSSVFFNPAAMQSLDRFEVQAAYTPLFLDTVYNNLTLALPTMDFGCFGFSFAMISTDKISIRDYTGQELNVASQLLIEVMAGWAIDVLIKDLYAGFNIKIDTQGMDVYNDTGFGSDLGLLYRLKPDNESSASAAIVLKNMIEPQVKMSAVNDIIPRQLIMAGSYMRQFGKDILLSGFLDLYMPLGVNFVLKTGADAIFFKIFSLRLGYDSYGIYSAGAGVEVFNYGAIDYGFFITELDVQHRVSFKARFGDSVIAQRANKEKIEMEKVEKRARVMAAEELKTLREKIDKMTGEAKKNEFFKASHYAKGLENYYDGNLKMSVIEFETVFQADPEYMNTRYYLGLIKGILGQVREKLYSDEIIKIYRTGVEKYVKEDYAGARDEWEKILKLDPYNRLAIDNLKEVNSILRNLEETK